MNANKQFIAWLNDAYSMESALGKVLQNHARDAQDLPEVEKKINLHITETHRHAELIKQCLAILGETPSMMKTVIGAVMGTVQGTATGPFRDEIIKNFISDYAAEHLEMACYRSLIAAAEELEQPEIVRICGEILGEEKAMAAWLEDRIPEMTRMALLQAAAC
jgi:ferritin-like metal-binding protein YciE